MPGKVDIYTDDWCNMVFDGRNKDYGAFEDRQKAPKRHTLALIIAVSVFTVAVSAPVLIKALAPTKKMRNVEVTSLADIKIEKPLENLEVPPPPPPVQNLVKFTPPEVTNEEVTEEVKTIDELKDTKAQISVTDVAGHTDASEVADLKVVEEKEEPLAFVEQMPEFPGGQDALFKYLNSNIKYPSIAQEMGISGKVVLQFVVDKQGKIGNIKVIRTLGAGCDEEAVRVVKAMPSWKAGRQNGKSVPVYFTLPVFFQLKE